MRRHAAFLAVVVAAFAPFADGLTRSAPSAAPTATAAADDVARRRQRVEALERSRAAIDAELAALGAVAPAHAAGGAPSVEPKRQIKALYAAFNARDADAVAALLAEDVVYEDLLLGASTVCRGRDAFARALAFHPAFLAASLGLPMGRLELVVDAVACDGAQSVGVEWHVELDGRAFPLSRGLSLATLNGAGELARVVDIAEAPWRVVGLVVRPFLSLLGFGVAAGLT